MSFYNLRGLPPEEQWPKLSKYFEDNFPAGPETRMVRREQELYKPASITPGIRDTILIIYYNGTFGNVSTDAGYKPAEITTYDQFLKVFPDAAAKIARLKAAHPNLEFAFAGVPVPFGSGRMEFQDRIDLTQRSLGPIQAVGPRLRGVIGVTGTDSGAWTGKEKKVILADGAALFVLITAQRPADALAPDGIPNFADASTMILAETPSGHTLSGCYQLAAASILDPGYVDKYTIGPLTTYSSKGNPLGGEVGYIHPDNDGMVVMYHPYTVQRENPLILPCMPQAFVDHLGELDKGQRRFVYVRDTDDGAALDVKADIEAGRKSACFLVGELRGEVSAPNALENLFQWANAHNRSVAGLSKLDTSPATPHYASTRTLLLPNTLLVPSYSGDLHHRVTLLKIYAGMTDWMMDVAGLDPLAPATRNMRGLDPNAPTAFTQVPCLLRTAAWEFFTRAPLTATAGSMWGDGDQARFSTTRDGLHRIMADLATPAPP